MLSMKDLAHPHRAKSLHHLFAMNKDPLFDRHHILLRQVIPSTFLKSSKHQLRLKVPLLVDVPVHLSLLVNQRVVVLEIAAEASALERDPERILMHGARVLGPCWEVLSVGCELGLELFDWGWVLKEEDLKGVSVGSGSA